MTIEQMAVRDEGPVAIASFVLRPQGADRPALFVVDAWARDGDDWRLRARYASPVPLRGPRAPGDEGARKRPR